MRQSRYHGITGAGDAANEGITESPAPVAAASWADPPAGAAPRLHLRASAALPAGRRLFVRVLPDADTESLFDFGLVGRCGGDAGVLQHAVAGIEDDRNVAQLSLASQRIHDGRGGGAISVVGDQQSVGGMRIIPRRQIKLAREVGVGFFAGLAIDSYYLLARGVSHACEDARLG